MSEVNGRGLLKLEIKEGGWGGGGDGAGWTVGREGGRGYVRTSWGQEDCCWCWMPGLRGKQHHVLLFTPHHSTVIVSSDLLVSAQNKRMDLSPNCSHNKGVCFIRASQGSGAPSFQFWKTQDCSLSTARTEIDCICFKPYWLTSLPPCLQGKGHKSAAFVYSQQLHCFHTLQAASSSE